MSPELRKALADLLRQQEPELANTIDACLAQHLPPEMVLPLIEQGLSQPLPGPIRTIIQCYLEERVPDWRGPELALPQLDDLAAEGYAHLEMRADEWDAAPPSGS